VKLFGMFKSKKHVEIEKELETERAKVIDPNHDQALRSASHILNVMSNALSIMAEEDAQTRR